MGLFQCIQSAISLRRLTAFLLLPELEHVAIPEPQPGTMNRLLETMDGSITFKNSSFRWVDPSVSHDLITAKRSRGRSIQMVVNLLLGHT